MSSITNKSIHSFVVLSAGFEMSVAWTCYFWPQFKKLPTNIVQILWQTPARPTNGLTTHYRALTHFREFIAAWISSNILKYEFTFKSNHRMADDEWEREQIYTAKNIEEINHYCKKQIANWSHYFSKIMPFIIIPIVVKFKFNK